jgi:hypothetical protein
MNTKCGKDTTKLVNKKKCRVTAKDTSDVGKQERGHCPETGREAVHRRGRNLMNHHKLTNY